MRKNTKRFGKNWKNLVISSKRVPPPGNLKFIIKPFPKSIANYRTFLHIESSHFSIFRLYFSLWTASITLTGRRLPHVTRRFCAIRLKSPLNTTEIRHQLTKKAKKRGKFLKKRGNRQRGTEREPWDSRQRGKIQFRSHDEQKSDERTFWSDKRNRFGILIQTNTREQKRIFRQWIKFFQNATLSDYENRTYQRHSYF